ncbi:HhH-GPD domain - like 5 [Theobroma cacao]|nr:HhH-GPD domain - like 5 [Theobroma cacao]
MGEQTRAQLQPQAQSQPQNDSSSSTPTQEQSQGQTQTQNPNNTSNAAVSTTVTSAVVTAAPTELTNVPPQTSSPPSKIPFRPRKIRKLSPDPNSDTNASQQATTSATSATEPPKTVAKTPKTKLTQHRALAVVPRIMARSLSCEGEVETAIRHLRNADPLLASLIDIHPPPTFDTFHTPFLALTRSILYQQLAFKAGTSIYNRFIALCGGENGVVPETVLSLTAQQLRQIGVSGRKASYLHDLARKYQTGILSDSAIVNMDDKSLFTMLTMVNGIGSWSVHMFMIFSLHRPDVLPINDLGVRKGVQLLYNLEELPRPSQMDQLCEKWRPYRSVASWYLWRFVEAKGAPSSAAAVAAGASLPPPQQEEQQQHQQHQQQPQLLDPINSILNLGIWIPILLGPVLGGNDWHWKQNVWHLSQSIGQLEGKALHRKMFV